MQDTVAIDQNFWVGRALAVLAVHHFAAAPHRLNPREVMHLAHLRDMYETRALLATVDPHEVKAAQELLEGFEQGEDRTLQSVALTEHQILPAFENLIRAHRRVRHRRLLRGARADRNNDLGRRFGDAVEPYAPLNSTALSHLLPTAAKRHPAVEEAQRLLVLLDEAAQVGWAKDLPEVSAMDVNCGISQAGRGTT